MNAIITHLSLIVVQLIIMVAPMRAIASISYSPFTTSTDSVHLTKAKVKEWIQARIAIAKLQMKMKANAGNYDDVVQAFYKARKKLLESKGWMVQDFNALKERINAAASAMDLADELKASKADHEEELSGIEANEYLTEKKKAEMIKGLKNMRKQQRVQVIEPTKPDWPAVRPWRNTLKHLTDWYAGNRPDPPLVE